MRHDRHGQQLTRATGRRAGLVAAAVGTLAFSLLGPAQAAPDDVTTEDVEAAFHEVEIVAEQVNQLSEDVKATQEEIDGLDADIDGQLVEYRRQKDALAAAIVQQQLDAPLGPTVNLFGSADPEEFLDGLGAVQALNSSRADALEQFGTTAAELENRQAQLEDRQTDLEKDRKTAGKKEAEVRAGYRAAKAELARLTAAEQKTFNTSETEVDFEVDAAGRAKKAIDFARSQLGDPYVYGGTGPDGWDCSGLMMKSFAAAGVSIPRVVGPQYGASKPVSLGELKPGDIVFYGDMSHDGLYIGNGKVIHAPRPGKSVEVTGMSGFTKAGRVV